MAAARDQAGIVYKATAKLVKANLRLQKDLKVLDSTKRIIRRDKKGTYIVLSADGDVQDGIRPSLLIRDEIHRWKSARAETLRDVTTKGQISRREPLDIQVTTAGVEYESMLWWREYQFAKQVQADPSIAPDYYVAIFEADRKRIEGEPEYWTSREARLAANPSHEDFGGHLRDEALVAELQKALQNASERPKYLRYHLNVPMMASEEPVIDMHRWVQCGGGVDLRQWPEYDLERLISEWGLAGQTCYVGVDASWTTDLTAAVAIFPPFIGSDEWTFLPFFWIPEEKLPWLKRSCKQPFDTWVRQGFVEATPGGVIDLRCVVERLEWIAERFNLHSIPYDRTNFRTEALGLRDRQGIEIVEVAQNFMTLNHPTKWLLGAYWERKIRHGNHPVLNWMASCFQLRHDQKDLCQPSKPEREKNSKRIDGMQAIVTGLAAALEPERESAWSDPSQIVI